VTEMEFDAHLRQVLAETVKYFDQQLAYFRNSSPEQRIESVARLQHQLVAARKQVALIEKRLDKSNYNAEVQYLLKLAAYTLDIIEVEIDDLTNKDEEKEVGKR